MAQVPSTPFTEQTACNKVQTIDEAWNARRPRKVLNECSPDINWRIGEQTFIGHEAIRNYLAEKWKGELHYRLKLKLRAFTADHISVHLVCEWQHCCTGQWFRTLGCEHWQFETGGLVSQLVRDAQDSPIRAADRRLTQIASHQARTINA